MSANSECFVGAAITGVPNWNLRMSFGERDVLRVGSAMFVYRDGYVIITE